MYSLIVVILDYVLGAFDYIRRRLLFKMVVSESVNLSIVTSANRCEAKTVGRPT